MILTNYRVLFYARSFLRKYAWAVELDENIVLDAYDSGSMITYEEVDVDEIELSGRRRSNRKKNSFLPLFYFVLFSLSILIFCNLLCVELYVPWFLLKVTE